MSRTFFKERKIIILNSYDMITTKSGIVKLVGQTLMVILSGIENKKHRQAAIKLCQKLNEKRVTMNGGLNLKLSFHLADIP